jgi:uncharacterized protein YjiS (DUF1127 family)
VQYYQTWWYTSNLLCQKRKFILKLLSQLLQKALKDAGISNEDAAAPIGVS